MLSHTPSNSHHMFEPKHGSHAPLSPLPEHPLSTMTTPDMLAAESAQPVSSGKTAELLASEPSKPASSVTPLNIDRANLDLAKLDMTDIYVASFARGLVIDNWLKRNLLACAVNIKRVNQSNADAYSQYLCHTLNMLKERLDSKDLVWYPAFTQYEPRFYDQIRAHDCLKMQADEIRSLLPANPRKTTVPNMKLEYLSARVQDLTAKVALAIDFEEELVIRMGRQMPLSALEHLIEAQRTRQTAFVAEHGQMWCATVLSRTMLPEELSIVPPDLPKILANVMMTATSLQFNRALSFARCDEDDS